MPAPLVEAQPRVYKSFRGRQMKGIALGLGGAAISLLLFGRLAEIGYLLAFTAALPGFAYGYYQPQGQPLEYWLRVQWCYFTTPQQWGAAPPPTFGRRLAARRQHVHSLWRAGVYLLLRRWATRKERKPRVR
ncbi:MAG: PrgI family protein [Bacillota bacterium]